MGKRTDPRLQVQVPVRIWGMDAKGKPFSQQAQTADVSLLGARIGGVTADLQKGEVIAVQHKENKARFKIAWVGNPDAQNQRQLGLICLEPNKCIWAMVMPRTARDTFVPSQVHGFNGPAASREPELVLETSRRISAPAAAAAVQQQDPNLINAEQTPQPQASGRNRRTHQRHNCHFGVELYTEGNDSKVFVTCTDIGVGGCYLETRMPFPIGTKFKLRMVLDSLRTEMDGMVRTVDTALGMGVEFLDVTESEMQKLRAFLRNVTGEPAAEEKKDPKPAAGTTHGQVCELLKTATEALAQMDTLFRSTAVDTRVQQEYRTAVEHLKHVASAASLFCDLREKRGDPFTVFALLTAERVRLADQAARELTLDVDSTEITYSTEGITELLTSVKSLANRLEELMMKPGSGGGLHMMNKASLGRGKIN